METLGNLAGEQQLVDLVISNFVYEKDGVNIYRTKLLWECRLQLPEHTFYVDNIFVYHPLPYVKTMYYLNVDFYRYYIGREDQSVNEQVMIGRIHQQLKVNYHMI